MVFIIIPSLIAQQSISDASACKLILEIDTYQSSPST